MSLNKYEKLKSGSTDTWITPPWILERLGKFDQDPCPINGTQGLVEQWRGRVWLNPPYSKNKEFMEKMANHRRGIALIFARTETAYFQKYVFPFAYSILFLNKRLKFFTENGVESKFNAGAPSVLISYTEEDHLYVEKMRDVGFLVQIKKQ